jgi:RimJ/RimL family protein N-acetyltransferase
MASTPLLRTERLVLTPLRVSDAGDMVEVLAEESLYRFTGGGPLSMPELRARYRAQVAGPPSGEQVWHNWIIRLDQTAVGFVQATVTPATSADVAWVVGVEWQGRGIATEAARAMCRWLLGCGAGRLLAHIHPDHAASARVAIALGFQSTGNLDADGEMVWELRSDPGTTS